MTEFSGKAILVLGGSRGIGADIVRRFARDGGTVAFSYFGSQEAAEALTAETRTEALRCDSADRDAVVALVRGRPALDVMVVNAGLFVGGDPLALDAAAVDRMIDVNVRSPYHAAVEAGRRMGEGGRIVLVGSTNGDRVPWPGSAAYGMTKSAMQGMARGLARDFGARGITVNVVQPGPVDTEMNPAEGPLKDQMHSVMAIKRHATGKEIAGLVAYLAGPEAAIVTGAMHTIDGGFAA